MKLIAMAVTTLLLAGCADQSVQPDYRFAASVKPKDPPPRECIEAPGREPRMAERDHDEIDSAKAARRTYLWGRATAQQLKRCQIWAKGQR